MAFRIGQRVVCVNAKGWRLFSPPNRPQQDLVYTVRGFFPTGESIWLEEIRNEPREWLEGFLEAAFFVHRFRPVVERKTSIEIFERLLTPSPARVKDLCGNTD